MLTLGIETSGHRGSVALLDDGHLLGDRDLSREGRRHARTLIDEVGSLLAQSTLKPQQVDTIAVSIGPGSFTGLRVGVAFAKTWAYATKAPVIAVDTFLAIAAGSTLAVDRLHVISDAQRSDLFVGSFLRTKDDTWESQGSISIVPCAEWHANVTSDMGVTGPGIEKLRDDLQDRCQVESASTCLPQAEQVARIGERQAGRGDFADIWTLEPLYIRRSAAEEKADAAT